MLTEKTFKGSRTVAITAIILVTAIWGLAGPVIVWTLRLIPPFTFLFLRFLIASLVILPFALKSKFWREINRQNFPTLLGLSLLSTTFGLGVLFYGYQFTTALDGSLIALIAPLLIVAGGAFFLKEEITRLEKIGLLIAFAGSIVTLLQPLLETGVSGSKATLGNFLVLLYHISWAAYCLWDKKVGKKFSTLTITAVPIFISVPVFTLLAYLETQNSQFSRFGESPLADIFNFQSIFNSQSTNALPGILYMAILSYIVAYYLYEWSVRRIEVSEAALFGYLQPVFAFPAAYLLLGEVPTRYFLLGGVLIGIGVFLTEWKGRAKMRLS